MRKKEKLLSATRGVAKIGRVTWPPRAVQLGGGKMSGKTDILQEKNVFLRQTNFNLLRQVNTIKRRKVN